MTTLVTVRGVTTQAVVAVTSTARSVVVRATGPRGATGVVDPSLLTAETAARQTSDALLIPLAQKGVASGVATLDGSGTVPDAQIPATIARDAEVSTAVNAAVAALVNGAPGALDTLNELSTALGNDASFAATMTAALATRLKWRGAWTAITGYSVNDVVTNSGGVYVVTAAHTSPGSFTTANLLQLVPPSGTYVVGGSGSAAAMEFEVKPRAAVTTFPAASVRPTTPSTVMAFDVMPNGTPNPGAGNPLAWFDICDTDIRDSVTFGPACTTLFGGVDDAYAFIGPKALGGASPKDFLVKVPSSSTGGMTGATRWKYATGGVAAADDYTLSIDPFIILAVHGGSIVAGSGYRLPAAATGGFLYIPRINGTPSGTPNNYAATHPIAFDQAANKLWIHNGTAWKSVTLL